MFAKTANRVGIAGGHLCRFGWHVHSLQFVRIPAPVKALMVAQQQRARVGGAGRIDSGIDGKLAGWEGSSGGGSRYVVQGKLLAGKMAGLAGQQYGAG